MPKYNVTRTVPYTAEQVFAIAADVGSYKAFLPLVKRSVIVSRATLPDGRDAFDAELTVAYRKLNIQETMVSKVVIDRANRTVSAQSSDGPVKQLLSEWRLRELPNGGCEIDFTVDYTLKSRSLQFILSGMFDMIVRKIMSAFEERARQLYGPKPAIS